MSVGHIARGIEKAGIATVVIAAVSFKKRMEIMSLPRVLLTNNLIGRVLGKPGDSVSQLNVLRTAFTLLENAKGNGTIDTC